MASMRMNPLCWSDSHLYDSPNHLLRLESKDLIEAIFYTVEQFDLPSQHQLPLFILYCLNFRISGSTNSLLGMVGMRVRWSFNAQYR